MLLCGVSQLFSTEQNECPAECPYWAPSSVWKYIGVCSRIEECQVYNPILNYADQASNVCLPCKVFGCVSCKYSNPSDSTIPVTDSLKKLPDFCLKCARGYRRSEDGTMCYLVNSNIWSTLMSIILFTLAVSIAILSIRLVINREQLDDNLKVLVKALKRQQKNMLRDPKEPRSKPYPLLTDLTKHNVSGIGLTLYFRHLVFLGLVMALLFFASIFHVHIPCSNMIRIFKDPFRVYFWTTPYDVPSGFINKFFNKDANKLVDDIFNFKSVDEAINWNVVDYSQNISGVMYVLYITIMVMTFVYMVSQKRIMNPFASKSSKIKELSVVLKNLPSYLTSEEEVREMVYKVTGITPRSVSICYDLGQHNKTMNEFMETVEDLKEEQDSYMNLDKIEDFSKLLRNFKGSGECFLTFETTEQTRKVLKCYRRNIFDVFKCEIEPENVLWENVGYEKGVKTKIFGISVVTATVLFGWTVLFFVPYAIYTINSPMQHIMEILLLGLFVEVGNTLVSVVLRSLIDKARIVDREVVDGYLMFCSYFLKVLNTSMDIVLSHLVNYGGRRKVFSLLRSNPYLSTSTFKVGEEVSFGLSFTVFMVYMLIVLPIAMFVLTEYLLPILNAFLVLSVDLEQEKATKLMKYSTFDLSKNYSSDLAYFTCCLFLLFLIKDKTQACLGFLTLVVSCLFNYLKSHFIVLRRSSRKHFTTWRLSYFANVMWVFPTLILAMCPHYWNWRAGEVPLYRILGAAILHLLMYTFAMYLLFGPPTRNEINLTLQEVMNEHQLKGFDEEFGYKAHNPVYKFRRIANEYNVL